MVIPSRIRRVVFGRDHHECGLREFSPCIGELTVQHRVGRGMGGSKRLDNFANLFTLCAWHNQLIEGDVEAKQFALRHGVSVLRRHARLYDVDRIPVYAGGGWWFLDNTGCRVSVPDGTAEAIIEDLLQE